MSVTTDVQQELRALRDRLQHFSKQAFQPMPGDAAPPAGAPPMDPAAMGGAPAAAPPTPPGAPPMDPAAMGGMPAGAPPMPPGPPPADPAAMGGPPPIDPAVLMELMQALQSVTTAIQQLDKRVSRAEQTAQQTAVQYARCEGQQEQLLKLLGQPPPPATAPMPEQPMM